MESTTAGDTLPATTWRVEEVTRSTEKTSVRSQRTVWWTDPDPGDADAPPVVSDEPGVGDEVDEADRLTITFRHDVDGPAPNVEPGDRLVLRLERLGVAS